jgi:hypothetical protein
LILSATDVGELVVPLLLWKTEGKVLRVFRNSAYVLAGDELVLLLRGELRSPINVNLPAADDLEELLSVGEGCSLSGGEIAFDRVMVRTEGARVYRSGIGLASSRSPVTGAVLAKGIGALRLLYGAAESEFDIFAGKPFRLFSDAVLLALARDETVEARRFHSYLPLIGLGGGFTPAGDDFVGGFTATFNHIARIVGEPEILFTKRELEGRTVPESASLILYAQQGYVDEELAHLITSVFSGRRGRFFQDLLQVAKRGHTSGVDMSMGVLLAAAVLRERADGDGTLEKCLKLVRAE